MGWVYRAGVQRLVEEEHKEGRLIGS
jgi:hypothetical protein